jgi:hypothetical protein
MDNHLRNAVGILRTAVPPCRPQFNWFPGTGHLACAQIRYASTPSSLSENIQAVPASKPSASKKPSIQSNTSTNAKAANRPSNKTPPPRIALPKLSLGKPRSATVVRPANYGRSSLEKTESFIHDPKKYIRRDDVYFPSDTHLLRVPSGAQLSYAALVD